MEVTGRSRSGGVWFLALLLLTIVSVSAEPAGDPIQRVNQVADALAAGTPADAISVFDKSCPNYEQIRRYFEGLADSFDLTNQIEITDQHQAESDTTLTVSWDLTLTDKSTDATEHRTAEITVKLQIKDGKWKITEFRPIDIFNPAIRAAAKA